MTARAASHVLLVAPNRYRGNEETAPSNAFQQSVSAEEGARLAALAEAQHRALRDLLLEAGVRITVARALETTPDAPFCNNWFSTHPGPPRTLVLYPMLSRSRRLERRADLVTMLSAGAGRVVDLSHHETEGRFLESTGSLCLDDASRTAYAVISPRTDAALAAEWAATVGYRLVAFDAADAGGMPFYHTNVMMFLGHGMAGICLDAIPVAPAPGRAGRDEVARALTESGLEIVPIAQEQLLQFCGNCLPLTSAAGDPLLVMSSAAFHGFTAAQRDRLGARARLLHTDLSAFEILGGGSARCLLGELF